MKKVWTKPELFAEEFQLDQHVAKGCGVTTRIEPGSSVTVERCCCEQLMDKQPGTGGAGHWDAQNVTIYDDNKNGIVDWAEIVKYVGTAVNGNVTGGGHNDHNLAIQLPGEEIEVIVPLNS